MTKPVENGNVYPSFVPSAASRDQFTAPDSTASRPNPESLQDRPRAPDQVPETPETI